MVIISLNEGALKVKCCLQGARGWWRLAIQGNGTSWSRFNTRASSNFHGTDLELWIFVYDKKTDVESEARHGLWSGLFCERGALRHLHRRKPAHCDASRQVKSSLVCLRPKTYAFTHSDFKIFAASLLVTAPIRLRDAPIIWQLEQVTLPIPATKMVSPAPGFALEW